MTTWVVRHRAVFFLESDEVTGMEAALDLVRQCWVNRPLTELEVQRHLAARLTELVEVVMIRYD